MKHFSFFFLICSMLLGATAAWATTVIEMDIDALTKASDTVVIATVSKVEAKVERGKVFTHVTLDVSETLKGDAADTLRIVHIGGRTKNLATVVHGMPDFREDERALLFLEKPESVNHYVVTGLSQGKFELEETVDGDWMVRQKSKNPAMVRPLKMPTGDVELKRATADEIQVERQSLSDLRDKIEEALSKLETTE